jgi:undecaprenyl-diphosphatase
VQIIGESFPVSSSGHLALLHDLATLAGYQVPSVTTTVWFNHLLHVPTIVMIVCFFSRRWWRWRILLYQPRRCKKIIVRLVGTVFIADLLTSTMYLLFKVGGTPWWHLAYGFCVTGLVLYRLRVITIQQNSCDWIATALALGIAQSISLLPGISRFALTYVCARWCGHAAQQSFELSWLVGWPLMVAGALHGLLGLYFCGIEPELLHPMMLWIILGATVMAWCALWLVYRMALAGTLYKLAYYMLLPLTLAVTVHYLL